MKIRINNLEAIIEPYKLLDMWGLTLAVIECTSFY